jgi:hypothetical protein
VAILAMVAGALAACGTSGSGQTASAGAQAGPGGGGRPQLGADQQAQFAKFRNCMKQHGVDLPDLSRGGPPSGGPPGGVDPTSSKFRSAIRACRGSAPRMGPPGGFGGAPPGGFGGRSGY